MLDASPAVEAGRREKETVVAPFPKCDCGRGEGGGGRRRLSSRLRVTQGGGECGSANDIFDDTSATMSEKSASCREKERDALLSDAR